jgi:hypothetical protein
MHEETRSILVGAAAGITDVERYGEFRQDIDRLDERRDALAFIAGARHLTLRLDPDDEVAFEVWSDGRRSLAEFVRGR